jgi:hypothetical protein
MSASHIKLNLGLAMLVFFSLGGPLKGTALWHASAYSFLPPFFSLLPAPPLQSTGYPATQVITSGYPEPPTATTGPASSATKTATPGLTSSATPVVNQTIIPTTPGLPTGTPSQTSTAGQDIFLTENAEMGQSQATPLPTETPSPSATLTTTLTPTLPTQPPAVIPPDEGFQMNWSVFLISFFAVIVIGGAAWLTFLRRFFFPKA